MPHVIRSRPTVAAVYRLLPAPLDELIAKTGMSCENTRNAVKLLLVTKTAYCTGWTSNFSPIIAAGRRPNVPRQTPERTRYELIAREKPEQKRNREEYQRAYREANREKRVAYNHINREKLKTKRNERIALKRAIARGELVTQAETIKTVWRIL